jgi:predicted metal-binding protein
MSEKPLPGKYAEMAQDRGVKDANLIPAESIVTARWVRLKCQYGCGGYGKRLTCPPFSPTPKETRKMLKDYTTAILVHGGEDTDITGLMAELEREAFLDGYYKAFAMGSGPCHLCEECDVEEGECEYPSKARPAMEACGIDVFATVRGHGFPIEVVKDESCEQNYFGLLLLE